MNSPLLSPMYSSPPQRPNKSRLRTVSTIDQFSSLSDLDSSSMLLRPQLKQDDMPMSLLKTSKSLTSMTPTRTNLSPSTSTPPIRKYSSNGSILSGTSKHPPSTSLNRADLIIARLEDWHQFLKSVTGWLEDMAKISLVSSRSLSQCSHSLSALQTITMQLAAEHQEQSQTLQQYVLDIVKLRKEAKQKIHKWKHDPALVLDELLRRAEVTRSKMTGLAKCCKQMDEAQADMDPWLANSLVLFYLKREVEEENRLCLLLLPIQKEAQDFEQRVLNTVTPAIEYCCQKLAPHAASHIMEQIVPVSDWEQFVAMNKRDLVDEKSLQKDHLKINYPCKSHPAVKSLFKGHLQRKLGRNYVDKYYVLTQGGYLHEYAFENHLTPEKTFYIPSTTIIPSVDIHQLTKGVVDMPDADLTFEICQPSTTILQKDKVSLFKAFNQTDLLDWSRLLIQVSTGPFIQASLQRKSS